MKKLLLHLVVLFSLSASANPFLVEVNKEWLNQPDINLANIAEIPSSETHAIQTHLRLVEQTLRARSVEHLSYEQLTNRNLCLDILHKYWNENLYPKNEDYDYRTPIFIDESNTFCAVGHLMKESGFENIAREISKKNNLVYVRDMLNAKAADWMVWAGLTMEECAWIQPGYPPTTKFNNCGKGVNGTITDLHPGVNEMIVLGDFNEVDSNLSSFGVAKWKKTGPTFVWEDFSQGLPTEVINGQMRPRSLYTKIIEYNGKWWLGGQWRRNSTTSDYNLFTRDGSSWELDSSLKGRVMDFAIYNNHLYACGIFYTSSGSYYLAKLNSSTNTWQFIFPANPSSSLLTMTEYNGNLILGGEYINYQNCDNIFAYDGTNIAPLYLGMKNPVRTIEVHRGQLYASGDLAGFMDTYNIKYFNGSVWLDTNTFNPFPNFNNHIACLKSIDTTLYWGGDFTNYSLGGTYSINLMNSGYGHNWGAFDSTINDIELFDGKIYLAGAMTNSFTMSFPGNNNLNRICYIEQFPTNTKEVRKHYDLSIYPNPSDNFVRINTDLSIVNFALHDISGRSILSGPVDNIEIDISTITKGMYLLKLKDIKGNYYVKRIYKK